MLGTHFHLDKIIFLLFELFFPMFSLFMVFSSHRIAGFLVPLSFKVRTVRGVTSVDGFSISTIVLDDSTHGKQILLFIFTSRLFQSEEGTTFRMD